MSDSRFHKHNLNIIRYTLLKNCYPLSLVNFYNNKRIKQFSINKRNNNVAYYKLPYHISFARQVENLFRPFKISPVWFLNHNSNSLNTRLQDKIDKNYCSNLVHTISCQFVDQVTCNTEKRCYQHKYKITNNNPNQSTHTSTIIGHSSTLSEL